MQILKSRFFWLNLIAILVLVIQQIISNNLLPKYGIYEAAAIAILNAIAGMIQGQQFTEVKLTLKTTKEKVDDLTRTLSIYRHK